MDVGVIGLGLIGGSIALNLVSDLQVAGFDLDAGVTRLAFEKGFITHPCANPAELANSKVIFIASPPSAVASIFDQLAPHLKKSTVVTDCAGVKKGIVESIARTAFDARHRFVGGHPMAGRETSGLVSANRKLFEGARWLLTPHETTEPWAVELVSSAVQTFGAHPFIIDAESHDEIVALSSHLPHVVASSLAQMGGSYHSIGKIGAGSWGDLTRVAQSDPNLWTEICMVNRIQLIESLRSLTSSLSAFTEDLESGRQEAIFAHFVKGKIAKDKEGKP